MNSGEVRIASSANAPQPRKGRKKMGNSTVTSFLVVSSLCFKPISN